MDDDLFAELEGFLEDEAVPEVAEAGPMPDESVIAEAAGASEKAVEPVEAAPVVPTPPAKTGSRTAAVAKGASGGMRVHGVEMTMSVLSDESVRSLQEQLTWLSVDEMVETAGADAATRSTVGSYFVGTVVGRSGLKSTARKQSMAFLTLNVLRDVEHGQKAGEDHVSLLLMSGAITWIGAATIGAVLIVQDVQVLPEKEKSKDSGKSSKGAFTETRVTVKVAEADQIVMVGRAAHVAACKGIRKDGGACTLIVDPRKVQYCSYHIGAAARAASTAKRKSKPTVKAVPAATPARPTSSIVPVMPGREEAPRGMVSMGTMAAGTAARGPRTLADFGVGRDDKRPKVRVAPVTANAVSTVSSRANSVRAARMLKESRQRTPAQVAAAQSLNAMVRTLNVPSSTKARAGGSTWSKDTTVARPQLRIASTTRAPPAIARPQGRRGMEQLAADASRKEVLSRKLSGIDLEALKRAKSSHEQEDSTLDQRRNARLNALQLKEQANEVMESTFEVRVRAERCLTCVGSPWSERGLAGCRKQQHKIETRKDVLKRFFRCADCRSRTIVLGGAMTVKEAACEHPPSAYRRVSRAAYMSGSFAAPSSGAVQRAMRVKV